MTNEDDPAYRCWVSMRQRCRSPKASNYPNYGARGITVCERWDSFAAFIADMGPRPAGYTIERIDNDGNYEPDNCRWATRAEQHHNKQGTRRVIYRGQQMSLQQARVAANSPVSWSAVDRRLKSGWSLERALHEPLMELDRLKERQRISHTLRKNKSPSTGASQ